MSRLISLYPKGWRRRYEAALRTLLDDRPATLADRLDLVRGAFDAHLHPELVNPAERTAALVEPPSEDTGMARRLGYATLLGAVAWIAAWIVQSFGPMVVGADGLSYRDGRAALPILLLSGGLLVAGLTGQLLILPRSARLARAGAVIAIPGVLLWSLVPWNPWTAATALVGLGLLALGAGTARVWPIAASGALIAMVFAIPMIMLGLFDTGPVGAEVTPGLVAFVATPILGWLAVGATLVWPRQPATERV